MKRGFKDRAGHVAELRRKIRRMRAEGQTVAAIEAALGTTSVSYHLKAMGIGQPARYGVRGPAVDALRRQVASLRAEGLTRDQINARLGITTAGYHLDRMRQEGAA